MNDTKLADLAVSILSQLPTPKVEAFSARGGVVLLELQSQDGVYIIAEAPRPQVRDVLRRESERTTPRAAVEELALMHVLGARRIAEGEEFDVRLADLSPTGV